jgi:hypothetical protein
MDESPYVSQIRKDARALYGALLCACQGGVLKIALPLKSFSLHGRISIRDIRKVELCESALD